MVVKLLCDNANKTTGVKSGMFCQCWKSARHLGCIFCHPPIQIMLTWLRLRGCVRRKMFLNMSQKLFSSLQGRKMVVLRDQKWTQTLILLKKVPFFDKKSVRLQGRIDMQILISIGPALVTHWCRTY